MRPRLDIVLALLVAVLLVGFLLAISLRSPSPGGSQPATITLSKTEAGLEGAALPEGAPAPEFALADQRGGRVSMGAQRGHVVVLAFLYSTCGRVCVLIAQQIRGALDELRRPVPVLIVSADPAADTPASVSRFLSEVSLTGRVHYLTGTRAQLRRVWSLYRVVPESAGSREFGRYATVTLIDPLGRERDIFQQEQLTPEALSHDIRALAID